MLDALGWFYKNFFIYFEMQSTFYNFEIWSVLGDSAGKSYSYSSIILIALRFFMSSIPKQITIKAEQLWLHKTKDWLELYSR